MSQADEWDPLEFRSGTMRRRSLEDRQRLDATILNNHKNNKSRSTVNVVQSEM